MTLQTRIERTEPTVGDGPADTILFIHPLGVDHRIWVSVVADLPEHRCIRFDLPGHGAAPIPDHALTIEEFAEQVVAVLDEEAIGRAHVVGMSLGGTIAQQVAATRPDRVLSVTIADSVPAYPPFMQEVWRKRASVTREHGMAELIDELMPIWFTPEALEADGADVRYIREALTNTDPEGYALACESLAACDVTPLLPDISVPALVICGDSDLPMMKAGAETIHGLIPSSHLIWLTPGAHAAALESRSRFVEVLSGLVMAASESAPTRRNTK